MANEYLAKSVDDTADARGRNAQQARAFEYAYELLRLANTTWCMHGRVL